MLTVCASRIAFVTVTIFVIALGAGLLGQYASRLREAPPLPLPARPRLPVPEFRQNVALTFPDHEIVLRVASLNTDSDALHRLRLLRARNGSQATLAMISSRRTESSPKYDLFVQLPNDAVRATIVAFDLAAEAGFPDSGWVLATRSDVRYWQEQTRILEMLYEPVSSRVAGRSNESLTVVADILRVAKHYSLPLVLFTEVGGRDHDYIGSDGLVQGAQWRSMPTPGDFILARTPERVLAMPQSAVSWKLTEQAIQYGQFMCTRDGIDRLRALPAHLQPPPQLTRDIPIGPVITYSGRILRDLVDLCHGSPECALQALSTSSTDATVRFDVGVRRTALYARRTLHHIGGIARFMIGDRYAARQ